VEAFLSREVARELVRYQLIRCRELAGKTQKEAATKLGTSQAYYAQFENSQGNKRRPDQEKLSILLEFFGAPDRIPILSEVLEIARSSMSGGKYSISNLISDIELYLALEHFATSLDVYEPNVVNGLLQTPEYARATVDYAATINPDFDADTALDLRMQRQLLLERKPSPLKLTMYVEEAVFTRPVGGVDVLHGQLLHLLKRRHNVMIRVIPQATVMRPTGGRPLGLMRFTDQWRVGYAETPISSYYYDAPGTIEQCGTIMGHLHHIALGADESRRLIDRHRQQVGA